MNSHTNLDIQGPNSVIKEMNCWITYTSDLFIVLKVCKVHTYWIS